MNCYKCGEEIIRGNEYIDLNDGYMCKLCFEKAQFHAKKNEEKPLSPREAIIAMLDGEKLITGNGDEVAWNEKESIFVFTQHSCYLSCFVSLYRKPAKKTRPMDAFQRLAWAGSAESQGWMVSIKTKHDGDWRPWDIPQRFKYNGDEDYKISFDYVSYRRAKVLPDKSGIDESTIQGFDIEEEQA